VLNIYPKNKQKTGITLSIGKKEEINMKGYEPHVINVKGVEIDIYPKKIVNAMARTDYYIKKDLKDGNYKPVSPEWYIYLRNLNKRHIGRMAGLEDGGAEFDTAVPADWLDRPENLKRWRAGNWAVWYYAPRDALGKPVWSTEIWRKALTNIRNRIPKERK